MAPTKDTTNDVMLVKRNLLTALEETASRPILVKCELLGRNDLKLLYGCLTSAERRMPHTPQIDGTRYISRILRITRCIEEVGAREHPVAHVAGLFWATRRIEMVAAPGTQVDHVAGVLRGATRCIEEVRAPGHSADRPTS